MSTPWTEWTDGECAAIRGAGQWRSTRALDGGGPRFGDVVSFASNDYLALTQHPAVRRAAHDAIDRWGTGSGSARLIVGSRPIHDELESALAEWKRTERAVLFPTGFAANLSVLTVFGDADATVYSDELNHASIIDGCRMARARVEVYRHNDIDQLAKLLVDAPGRAIVITDTVFSMDGDCARVEEIVELCADRGALLVVDEAHAVLGPDPDYTDADVLRVGTLSKTLGAIGGFVAGRASMIDLIVNRARPFIFTTAPTPADTAAALAALTLVRGDEGDALRARLRANVDRVRPGHPSPIVPIVLGDESRALAASSALLGEGLLVPAIRPPTVAPGTSRLRVALSAADTDAEIDRLTAALPSFSRQ